MNIIARTQEIRSKFPRFTDVHVSTLNTIRKDMLAMPHGSVRFALEGLAADLLAKTQFAFLSAGVIKLNGMPHDEIGNGIFKSFGDLRASDTTPKTHELKFEALKSGNLYKMKWENWREINDGEETISLTVTKCDPTDPDYPRASIFGGHVTFKANDGKLRLVRSMVEATWPHEWDDILAFADDIKPIWDSTACFFDKSGRTIGGHNLHDINTTTVAELIEADNGWIGEHTREAMDIVFASCYHENLKCIAEKLTELSSLWDQMGLNGSVISYGNDDFDIVQIDQTKFFISKFLEFNTDYTTTVTWSETDEAGDVSATNIVAFRYGEVEDMMDLLSSGSLKPTISLNHKTHVLTIAQNARETDCLEQVGATLRWVPKILENGNFRVTGPSREQADHINKNLSL